MPNDPPYGQQFAGVDIALDNYPYNGVTTTCESLYLGVPVVSLYGRNGVSRSGLSLLGALGLGELAASTPEQYVEIAVALGSDLSRLEQLRASLRARFEQSSLRDEKRFAANFEELLRTAWQQHRGARMHLFLPALRIAEHNPKNAAIAVARLVQQYGAVQLAQFARNEKPKSRAAFSAGKERLENTIDGLRLDPGSAIRDFQDRVDCWDSGGRA